MNECKREVDIIECPDRDCMSEEGAPWGSVKQAVKSESETVPVQSQAAARGAESP